MLLAFLVEREAQRRFPALLLRRWRTAHFIQRGGRWFGACSPSRLRGPRAAAKIADLPGCRRSLLKVTCLLPVGYPTEFIGFVFEPRVVRATAKLFRMRDRGRANGNGERETPG